MDDLLVELSGFWLLSLFVVGHHRWFMDVGEKLQCVTESFEVVIGRFGWFTGGNRSLLVFVIAIVLVGQRRWFDGGSGCLWVRDFLGAVVAWYGWFVMDFVSLPRFFRLKLVVVDNLMAVFGGCWSLCNFFGMHWVDVNSLMVVVARYGTLWDFWWI